MDSSNFTNSPTLNTLEFKYTISTLVAEDLVTIWATAPLSGPTILSPRIEDVSKDRPDGNSIESNVGAELLYDS